MTIQVLKYYLFIFPAFNKLQGLLKCGWKKKSVIANSSIVISFCITTDKATYNSDIDIAWIPAKKVPITELAIKTESLRNVLDIDVDLKIVTDNYTVELRKNIFEGDIIYESKDFKDYLNNFYIENSDVIDILNWRDMYGS